MKYQRLGLCSQIAEKKSGTLLRGGGAVTRAGMPGAGSRHARECSEYTYTRLSSSTAGVRGQMDGKG